MHSAVAIGATLVKAAHPMLVQTAAAKLDAPFYASLKVSLGDVSAAKQPPLRGTEENVRSVDPNVIEEFKVSVAVKGAAAPKVKDSSHKGAAQPKSDAAMKINDVPVKAGAQAPQSEGGAVPHTPAQSVAETVDVPVRWGWMWQQRRRWTERFE